MAAGAVAAARDLVVMVQFDTELPDIGELLLVQNQNRAVLMVDHLAKNKVAVCHNLLGDRSVQKRQPVERTGRSVEVPVGPATIGLFSEFLRSVMSVADPTICVTRSSSTIGVNFVSQV